jgi:alkylated DNA repair protein alkB family protein 7
MRRTIADELIRKTVSSTDFSDPNSQQSIDTDALWQVAGGWKTMHILDLNADGEIGAHVDHRDYSGRLVSALCLLSTAVVRFTHTGDSGRFVDVLLRPGTLYGHTGKARFDYKHSIVAQQAQQYEFQGMRFPQKRRVSLMLRSCK